MIVRYLSVIVAFAAMALAQAPVVQKVEPPNWWVQHSWNPVEVMLTGKNLRGARASASGLDVSISRISGNGSYLWLSLQIPSDAKPGNYRIALTTAAGTQDFNFPVLAPVARQNRFQGFNGSDVIYLLMPDRFANGNSKNDTPPEYRQPADRRHDPRFHGGDLAGIRAHLSYLKDLGVTALWLTPTYKNSSEFSQPYHGYHTVDFYAVEPRFGTHDDYRQLVDEAHRQGLKVMQDEVINHTGPYHPWLKQMPTPTWFHYADRMPRVTNSFEIEALADPHASAERQDSPLHGWFVGELPDLNQDDPFVAKYLIQNTLWWVATTGIDGIRMDTYPYVERSFWQRWQTALNREFPNFFVTGEITANSPAVLSTFEGGRMFDRSDTGLPSMLDFPLFHVVQEVFAKGEPMRKLSDLLGQDFVYSHPERLVTFLGNHDQQRFLTVAHGNLDALYQAQAFILTTRGIPHLYYGDEIAEGGQIASTVKDDSAFRFDFPGGWPSDSLNAFTNRAPGSSADRSFRFLQSLLAFRKQHRSLQSGRLIQLFSDNEHYAALRHTDGDCVLTILSRSNKPLDFKIGQLFSTDPVLRPWRQSAPVKITSDRLMIAAPSPVNLYAGPCKVNE